LTEKPFDAASPGCKDTVNQAKIGAELVQAPGLFREQALRYAMVRRGRDLAVAVIEDEADGQCAFLSGGEDAVATPLPFLTGAAQPRPVSPVPLAGLKLAPPFPHPQRNIICVGKNYADHARELAGSVFKDDAIPAHPMVFTKVPETVIGPGEPIIIDTSVSTAIDYEGELAVIIGRGGRNITKAEALSHVCGYTIVNDVTARDMQQRHGQWFLGKSQDGFCPMGPWVVTPDAVDLSNTGLRTYVNGELRQNANTRDLIFDVPTLIAIISQGITLKPGDIIATGTPAGVGMGFDPPRWLKAGDVVRIEIDGIGALENPVVEPEA
jgi:2-keto-4-pentenoate hydratase/2-oxohepta-3-ene-1,7-dioic acid hydratase in catechol pathway